VRKKRLRLVDTSGGKLQGDVLTSMRDTAFGPRVKEAINSLLNRKTKVDVVETKIKKANDKRLRKNAARLKAMGVS